MTQIKWSFAVITNLLISIVVVGGSWLMTQSDLQRSAYEVARIKGDSLFHLIKTTRSWNSSHGGVYVPVTVGTQPNVYLDTVDRDVTDSLGRKLTKVNPAYMLRQISDQLEGGDVEIRLASLQPIHLLNAADEWEKKMLPLFEDGQRDSIVSLEGDTFRFIAPLPLEQSCLSCHQNDKYQLGEVSGGISISFPAQQIAQLVDGLVAQSKNRYLLVFCSIFLLGMGMFLLASFLSKKLANSADYASELLQLANLDSLTGVLNHRAFIENSELEFKRSQRRGSELSILMLDLDHFKKVNDTHGHQAGDEVLISIVDQIRFNLRDSDVLGRWGGEEFCILLPDTSEKSAYQIAERIRITIEKMTLNLVQDHSEENISITVSIGSAERKKSQSSVVSEQIKKADQALYKAKNAGRNQTLVFY